SSGFAELADGIVQPPLILVGAAEPQVRPRKIRGDAQGRTKRADGFLVTSGVVVAEADVSRYRWRQRIELLRALNLGARLSEPSDRRQVHAVPLVCVNRARIQRERVTKRAIGVGEPPLVIKRDVAERSLRFARCGIERQRLSGRR